MRDASDVRDDFRSGRTVFPRKALLKYTCGLKYHARNCVNTRTGAFFFPFSDVNVRLRDIIS